MFKSIFTVMMVSSFAILASAQTAEKVATPDAATLSAQMNQVCSLGTVKSCAQSPGKIECVQDTGFNLAPGGAYAYVGTGYGYSGYGYYGTGMNSYPHGYPNGLAFIQPGVSENICPQGTSGLVTRFGFMCVANQPDSILYYCY